MNWPWINRKKHQSLRAELEQAKANAAKLKEVIGTLRAELIAKKQDVRILETVAQERDKHIEKLEQQIAKLSPRLNSHRMRWNGPGGIRAQIEAQDAQQSLPARQQKQIGEN